MPKISSKPTRIVKRETSVYWIDLTGFYHERAVWKVAAAGREPQVCVGPLAYDDELPSGEVEYEFPLSALTKAYDDLTTRKMNGASEDDDEPYGPGVDLGELGLLRAGRYEYEFYAPCGEVMELRAGELRLLVAAIRELGVSTMP